MSNKLLLLLITSTIALTNLAIADDANKIAAVVNNQVITQSELDATLADLTAQQKTGDPQTPPATCKTAMNQLIDRDLQLQIANSAKITVSDDELNTALTQIATDHQLTLAQLPQAIAHQGMDYTHYKAQIKKQLLIQKFQQQQLSGSINITPKEINQLAAKLQQQQKTQAAQPQVMYHFIEIVLPLPAQPTPAQLEQAKQQFDTIAQSINQGKDFQTIAMDVVHTPPQDLGWRSTNQMPSGFIAIASKMAVGQVAQPVRAPDGIHILKLVDKKTATATDNSPAQDNTITETNVRHILLKKDALTPDQTLERRLMSIRDAIVHGEDFSEAAEKYSEDPGSVSNGGNLGWVKPETLDPKFEAAMNKLKVGEISQPIKTQFGWHLIEVLGRKQVQDADTAWKMKAQQILFQQKMQTAVKQMVSQLRAQAYLKIFDKNCQ